MVCTATYWSKIFKTEKLSVSTKTNPKLNNRPAETKLVVVVSEPSALAQKSFFHLKMFLETQRTEFVEFFNLTSFPIRQRALKLEAFGNTGHVTGQQLVP